MTQVQQGSLSWKKSTRSAGTGCVEVARTKEIIFVRDSKDPQGPTLIVSRAEWGAFLAGPSVDQFKI